MAGQRVEPGLFGRQEGYPLFFRLSFTSTGGYYNRVFSVDSNRRPKDCAPVYEVVGNLHVHTTYSDGSQPHDVVAAAAVRAGLDFLVITDHNVRVTGIEGAYQTRSGGRVLLLTGEEVHDMLRRPQRNHLLVYGAAEMATSAQGQHPQALLDAVNEAGGCAFLAHPTDRKVAWINERSYRWDDWDIAGYAGLELWNYMSVTKYHMPDLARGLRMAFDPAGAMDGPEPEALALWDDLLRQGQRVAVIGSADAHGTRYRLGPLRKTVFPYAFLFRCVNTHVLLEAPLSGSWQADAAAIYRAIALGHAFVGYGLPADPRGFRFEARPAAEGAPVAIMGDMVPLDQAAALHVTAPAPAHLRLIRDGAVVAEASGQTLTHRPDRPGAYRVEAWKSYRGRARGWVFSNPIYLGPAP